MQHKMQQKFYFIQKNEKLCVQLYFISLSMKFTQNVLHINQQVWKFEKITFLFLVL